jgi:hypothetical protein
MDRAKQAKVVEAVDKMLNKKTKELYERYRKCIRCSEKSGCNYHKLSESDRMALINYDQQINQR